MEVIGNKSVTYEFGNFVLDPQERTLVVGGRAVHLPAKEFDLLLLLVQHNGRALTKAEMMSAIWGKSFVEEGNLAKQISRLRKILNTNGQAYIETIPKYGYRFTADISLRILEEAKPVVIERRTVKRFSVQFDDGADLIPPQPGALPPAKRSFAKWRLVVFLAVIAVMGLGFLTFYLRRGGLPVLDPYQPVRLTDNPLDDTGPTWANDGRIHFTRIFPDNHVELWTMQPDGSDQKPIKMPEGKRILAWSPDGKRIQYVYRGDDLKIYLANADGSDEKLLPFRGGIWSPDSKMITYHRRVQGDNFDVFIYWIETGEIRNVTNADFFDVDPSFSPDGKRIVFASNRDGNPELYTIGIDGTDLRRLTNNPGVDSHGAFSPDGTQIAFGSDRVNENGDIYLINADGSGSPLKLAGWDKSNETVGPGGWSADGTKIVFYSDRNGKDDIYIVSAEVYRPRPVVSDPDGNLGVPAVSPDGKKLVYSTELDDRSGEIKTYDLESGRTKLVRRTEIGHNSPHWSPNGNWIAFTDRIDGNSEICLMRADGTEFQDLTNDPSSDYGATWSPDGKSIVFVSNRGSQANVPQLYIMDANGSNPHPITPKKGWEGEPIMTADGSSVIFSCDREDVPGNMLDICEINTDGTGERHLLNHRGHDTQPALSPDGQRIAFTAMSDGNAEIYIMNRDGSGLLRLTRNIADDVGPQWSPDGKQLYFSSNRDGHFAIYEIDI